MRTFPRYSWFGQDRHSWPIILLFLAALAPTLSLLWFMNTAMQNERFAAREKLSQAYRSHLTVAREQLEKFSAETVLQLEALATNPAPLAFSKCVQSGLAESVVLLNSNGSVAYPNRSISFQRPPLLEPSEWVEANHLEYARKDFAAAAAKYSTLSENTNVHLAARALQAQVRCLVASGKTNAALRVISETLGADRFRQATDSQGRLIVANAELLALELINNPGSPLFQPIVQTLQERLLDYSNPALAAPQRRFLMKELQRLSPNIVLPTLRAEELSAEYAESLAALPPERRISPTPIPDVWQLIPPNHQFVALFTSASLISHFQSALQRTASDAEIALLPPGLVRENALVTLPAGTALPGWQLALSVKDILPLQSNLTPRTALYLWTGVLALALMIVLTLLAIRLSRRHMALARLKTDLAATVSHELKTPLSSMRVLVDTLLQSKTPNEQTTHEYLQLISQENERLSRLIENFLCFSRLERNKWNFQFAPLRVSEIMNTVVLAVRTRFQAPDCRFEVQVQPDLPLVRADSQALSTALLNLLDNAYKYSGESKEILLQATASNGDVIFSVKDNGLGISPREAKRIFRPFYQVDQRLSRSSGGFGLGLSIVQQIVAAHNGRTFVESQPGQGSSFIIKLPAVDRSARPVHLSSTEAVVAVYDRQSAEASRDPEKRGNHSNPPCIRPPH